MKWFRAWHSQLVTGEIQTLTFLFCHACSFFLCENVQHGRFQTANMTSPSMQPGRDTPFDSHNPCEHWILIITLCCVWVLLLNNSAIVTWWQQTSLVFNLFLQCMTKTQIIFISLSHHPSDSHMPNTTSGWDLLTKSFHTQWLRLCGLGDRKHHLEQENLLWGSLPWESAPSPTQPPFSLFIIVPLLLFLWLW